MQSNVPFLFQKISKEVKNASEEQKSSEDEENAAILKPEKLSSKKPSQSKENVNVITQEVTEKLDTSQPFVSENINEKTEISKQPKEIADVKDSLIMDQTEKVNETIELKEMKPGKVKMTPKLDDAVDHALNVQEGNDLEQVEEIKKQVIDKKKSKYQKTPKKNEHLGISEAEKEDNVEVLSVKEPLTDKVSPKQVKKSRDSIGIDLKLGMEESTPFKEEVPEKHKLRKMSIEDKEESLFVEISDGIEKVNSLTEVTPKSKKARMKPTERKDSSLGVETRQKIENATEYTNEPELSQSIKPSKVANHKESLSIKDQEDTLDTVSNFQAQVSDRQDNIRPTEVKSNNQSCEVVEQQQLEDLSDFKETTSNNNQQKIKPAKVKQDKRSVSVSRQEKCEHTDDLETKELEKGEKTKAKKVKETKESVKVQTTNKDESTEIIEDNKVIKDRARSSSETRVKDPLRMSKSDMVESPSILSSNSDTEKAKAKEESHQERRESLAIDSEPHLYEIVEQGDITADRQDKATLLQPDERALSVSIEENQDVEEAKQLPKQDLPKEKIDTKQVNDKEISLLIEDEEAVEYTENIKPLIANKKKTRPKNPTVEKKRSVEVRKVNQSEESEPFVIKDVSDQVNSIVEEENVCNSKATVEDSIKTSTYIVEEPEDSPKSTKSSMKPSFENKAEEVHEKKEQPKPAGVLQNKSQPEEVSSILVEEPIVDQTEIVPETDISIPETKFAQPKKVEKRRKSVKVTKAQKVEGTDNLAPDSGLKDSIKPVIEEEHQATDVTISDEVEALKNLNIRETDQKTKDQTVSISPVESKQVDIDTPEERVDEKIAKTNIKGKSKASIQEKTAKVLSENQLIEKASKSKPVSSEPYENVTSFLIIGKGHF